MVGLFKMYYELDFYVLIFICTTGIVTGLVIAVDCGFDRTVKTLIILTINPDSIKVMHFFLPIIRF